MKRLPVEKIKMSACLGLKRFDGIVLCADSAELNGFVKRDADKIRTFGAGEEWEVAVALAGGGALGDDFWRALKDELANDQFSNESSIKEKIEHILKIYVEKYGATDDTFRMLVAIHGRVWNAELFCQTEAMLSPIQSQVAVGLGPDLCEFLLTKFDNPSSSIHDAEHIAVAIMSILADHVDGVERPIRVAKYVDSVVKHIKGRESEECGRFEFGDATRIEKAVRKKIDPHLKKLRERLRVVR